MSVAVTEPAVVSSPPLPAGPALQPVSPAPRPLVRPSLRPAPPLEPPYDDEEISVRTGAAPFGVRHQADVLPFAPAPRSAVVQSAAAVNPDDFAPQPTPRSALPAPQPWAGRLLQAALEVQAGQRALQQLMPWTSERVYTQLTWWTRRHPAAPAQVRSVHISEPADGVAEVCAVIRRGARRQAVAARLEGIDGRWQCTALRFL